MVPTAVTLLRDGAKSINVPVYDFKTHLRIEKTNPLSSKPIIILEGIFSHLSSSEKDDAYTDIQRKKFIDVSDYLMPFFKTIKYQHLANSAGLLKNKKNHFNTVRPGISVYGINNTNRKHNLKPVMRVEAPVCLIKNIKKDETIGYDRTYKAKRNMKIGVVQCGYGDGIPFNFSNKGRVYFKNCKIDIIGRVSMDLICISIDWININKSDKVIIYGGKLTKVELVSKNSNTVYTLLTGISPRVKRIYY